MDLLKAFIREVAGEKVELHVYDFDDTLFRSPPPPPTWSKKDGYWYSSIKSLTEPVVNDENIAQLWIRDVLESARTSLSDPSVYTVMMTGRNAKNIELVERIEELLASVGLNFPHRFFNTTNDTKQFKIDRVFEILDANPGIKKVTFWDDKGDFLGFYESQIEQNYDGIEVVTNHITA